MTTLFDVDKPTDYRGVVKSLTESLIKSELVSDTNIGGVAQILIETFAREMATFYAILEKAHEAGYLDTARGPALDNVVSILGVKRTQPGLLRGQVVFSRGTSAPQKIAIPAGTRVAGPPLEDGSAMPLMETVERAGIRRGERSVSVAVQEVLGAEPSEIASLPPLSLNIMPLPLLGVEKVSNPEPVMRGGRVESDGHLRARARAVLREGQKGTVEAIEAAVRSVGVQTVRAVDQPEGRIGCVEVRVGDPQLEEDADRQESVKIAVYAVKAAGIQINWKFLRSVYCHIIVTVTPEDKDIETEAFDELSRNLEQDVTAFVNNLGPGISIAKDKLKALLLGNAMVRKADIEMNMFKLEAPGSKNATLLPDRQAEGEWYIDPKEEKAIVNPDRWPVEILSRSPARAILFITATMHRTEQNMKETRRKVKETIESYVRSNRQQTVDGKPLSYPLDYIKLSDELKDKKAAKELLGAWIIHQDDGQVEYLTKDHAIMLRDIEELNFGRIDMKPAEED